MTTYPTFDDVASNRLLLRRGGQAGLAGSGAMFAAFAVVGILGLPDTSTIESLTTYPDIATGRALENSFYLAALVFWAVQFVAIGRALVDPATGRPPLAASVGVFGLIPMAAGALLHISTSALSDRYTDPAATTADRADIELVWHGVQALLDTLLVTGVAIVPLAVVALWRPLVRSKVVGRFSGGAVLALGLIGSVGGAAAVATADVGSAGIVIAVLSLIVVQTVIAWRLVRA